MFDSGCGLRLVHAEVAGQGPLAGVTFGHAWVLDGDTVIDRSNGRDVVMPRQLYYALGHVDEIANEYVYSWSETRDKLREFEHYGPWDLETATGL